MATGPTRGEGQGPSGVVVVRPGGVENVPVGDDQIAGLAGHIYLAGLHGEGEVGFVGALHFRAAGIGKLIVQLGAPAVGAGDDAEAAVLAGGVHEVVGEEHAAGGFARHRDHGDLLVTIGAS